jgi:hypothetical protein
MLVYHCECVVILKKRKRMRKKKDRDTDLEVSGDGHRSGRSQKHTGQVRSQVRGSRKNTGQVRSQVWGSQRPKTLPVTYPPTDGGDFRDFYHNWTNSILQTISVITPTFI